MKKLMIIAALIGLAGCGDAHNIAACRQSVVEMFKTTDVISIPSSTDNSMNYRFIARTDNGDVWYAETMNNTDAKVSTKTLLFKGKQ